MAEQDYIRHMFAKSNKLLSIDPGDVNNFKVYYGKETF